MSDFCLGFFGFLCFFLLFEPLIINFIYLSNCDLFLDLILLRKKRDKLIDTCVDRYSDF